MSGMQRFYNTNKKMIWIAMAILALLLLSNYYGDVECNTCGEKESSGEWGMIGLGIALIVLGIISIMSIGGAPIGVFLLLFGMIAIGAFSLFSGTAGALTPDEIIPGWAWLAGFGILLVIVLRRNK